MFILESEPFKQKGCTGGYAIMEPMAKVESLGVVAHSCTAEMVALSAEA